MRICLMQTTGFLVKYCQQQLINTIHQRLNRNIFPQKLSAVSYPQKTTAVTPRLVFMSSIRAPHLQHKQTVIPQATNSCYKLGAKFKVVLMNYAPKVNLNICKHTFSLYYSNSPPHMYIFILIYVRREYPTAQLQVVYLHPYTSTFVTAKRLKPKRSVGLRLLYLTCRFYLTGK